MAFLCPARRSKKSEKKKGKTSRSVPWSLGVGRLTGSDSLDTLVHLEAMKDNESPKPTMVIVQDFKPCVEDELAVSRGQTVRLIFQENDWMFVEKCEGSGQGFVPYTYCLPIRDEQLPTLNEESTSLRIPLVDLSGNFRDSCSVGQSTESSEDQCGGPWSTGQILTNGAKSRPSNVHRPIDYTRTSELTPDAINDTAANADVQPHATWCNSFEKRNLGKYIVLFNYWSEDENDACVQRGDFVTLLNKDDPDWFWISRKTKAGNPLEGFVPSNYLSPAVVRDSYEDSSMLPYEGTRRRKSPALMVCTRDYRTELGEDFNLREGDVVQVLDSTSSEDEFVLVFALDSQQTVHIRRSCIRPLD